MTDKEQIIINNCKLYKNGLCISPLGNEVKCEDISVDKCYFKQKIFAEQELARKTQECEELISEKDFYLQKIAVLEQRCRELGIKNVTLQNRYQQLAGATTKTDRYCEALEEIEETIKNLEKQDILTFPDFSLQENCKAIMKQCNDGYLQILDIIRKAKGGGNDECRHIYRSNKNFWRITSNGYSNRRM